MTLKADIQTDLATILNTDEFAGEGTYSPKLYAAVHPSSKSGGVDGIFYKEFVEINDTEAYAPVFDCATTDVSDASNGAKLTVNSVVYTVRGVQHAHPELGPGMTRLILEVD